MPVKCPSAPSGVGNERLAAWSKRAVRALEPAAADADLGMLAPSPSSSAVERARGHARVGVEREHVRARSPARIAWLVAAREAEVPARSRSARPRGTRRATISTVPSPECVVDHRAPSSAGRGARASDARHSRRSSRAAVGDDHDLERHSSASMITSPHLGPSRAVRGNAEAHALPARHGRRRAPPRALRDRRAGSRRGVTGDLAVRRNVTCDRRQSVREALGDRETRTPRSGRRSRSRRRCDRARPAVPRSPSRRTPRRDARRSAGTARRHPRPRSRRAVASPGAGRPRSTVSTPLYGRSEPTTRTGPSGLSAGRSTRGGGWSAITRASRPRARWISAREKSEIVATTDAWRAASGTSRR